MISLFVALSFSTFATSVETFDSEDSIISELVNAEDRAYVKKVKLDWIDKDLKEGTYTSADICEGDLIPENKSQKNKTYHLEASIYFNRKLPGPHPLCAISQRSTSKCRRLSGDELEQCRWKNLRCLKVKKQVFKILSDTYKDSCNQVVRGFALVSYSYPGEHMNDSVSPGHSLEVEAVFSGGIRSFRDGPISNVPQERFLIITPTF